MAGITAVRPDLIALPLARVVFTRFEKEDYAGVAHDAQADQAFVETAAAGGTALCVKIEDCSKEWSPTASSLHEPSSFPPFAGPNRDGLSRFGFDDACHDFLWLLVCKAGPRT